MNQRRTTAVLLSALAAAPAIGQDRLFEAGDRAARIALARELGGVIERKADLATTVALAATAGTALPEGSQAACVLRQALRVANAAPIDEPALRRLRSDLGDLVMVLGFEPAWEAELPAGFPGFGAVDELELRRYPRYRMARTTMRSGGNSAFWPLFRHIQSNDIAMTTPVQMDWKPNGERAGRPANMAFLYGNTAIETQSTARNVEVVEAPAQTVLSIGAIGADRPARVEAMRARLEAFLARPDCRYEAAGPLRTMGYNSPMVRRDRRYFEVQLPVRSRYGDC